MNEQKVRFSLLLALLFLGASALAGDDPRHERHELMEGVRDAAKPVGQMMRGEAEFDAELLMTSLSTFASASRKLGSLFPEGTETGGGTEAAPAIWEDRDGFDAAIARWQEAVATAIDAEPGSLEAAKPVVGPIFNACKACHDDYRIEDE